MRPNLSAPEKSYGGLNNSPLRVQPLLRFLALMFVSLLGWVHNSARADLSALAPMPTFRINHATTTLADGRVLVTGGTGTGLGAARTLNTSAIYNPVTNTWVAGPNMLAARSNHVSIRLADGRVMLFAGANFSDPNAAFTPLRGLISTAEIFDPSGNSFSLAATPPVAALGTDGSALAVSDGRVVFFSGVQSGGFAQIRSTPSIYNPVSNSWGENASLNSSANAIYNANYALIALPNNKILAVGDTTNTVYVENGVGTPSYLLDMTTGITTALPNAFPPTSNSNGIIGSGFVANPTLVKLPDGRVLAAMGSMSTRNAFGSSTTQSKAASIFNPVTNTWTAVASSSTPPGFQSQPTIGTMLTNDVVAIAKLGTFLEY